MMHRKSITLHREGMLHIEVTGDRHCGHPSVLDSDGVRKLLTVRYQVTIVARKLDNRGFLVDQEELHRKLQEWTSAPMSESCEELSGMLAHHLATWMDAEHAAWGMHPQRVIVRVSPKPFLGWLETEYTVTG